MNLRVIEGGLAGAADVPGFKVRVPRHEDVRREADRRLRRIGYDRWRSRQIATGAPMPREIRYQAMQIEFVAERLSTLPMIPTDYHSDIYWPA